MDARQWLLGDEPELAEPPATVQPAEQAASCGGTASVAHHTALPLGGGLRRTQSVAAGLGTRAEHLVGDAYKERHRRDVRTVFTHLVRSAAAAGESVGPACGTERHCDSCIQTATAFSCHHLQRWRQHRSSQRYLRHVFGGGLRLVDTDSNVAAAFDLPSKARRCAEPPCCLVQQRLCPRAVASSLNRQTLPCTLRRCRCAACWDRCCTCLPSPL